MRVISGEEAQRVEQAAEALLQLDDLVATFEPDAHYQGPEPTTLAALEATSRWFVTHVPSGTVWAVHDQQPDGPDTCDGFAFEARHYERTIHARSDITGQRSIVVFPPGIPPPTFKEV